MRTTIAAIASLCIQGCAASAPPDADGFSDAAMSWEGAPVAEMIQVDRPLRRATRLVSA